MLEFWKILDDAFKQSNEDSGDGGDGGDGSGSPTWSVGHDNAGDSSIPPEMEDETQPPVENDSYGGFLEPEYDEDAKPLSYYSVEFIEPEESMEPPNLPDESMKPADSPTPPAPENVSTETESGSRAEDQKDPPVLPSSPAIVRADTLAKIQAIRCGVVTHNVFFSGVTLLK